MIRLGSRQQDAAAWTLAFGSAAMAASAACIDRMPNDCSSSGSGYCQGTVTACGQGWHDVSGAGQRCGSSTLQESTCQVWKGCGPGACSSGSGTNVGCVPSSGQCCFCATFVTSYPSGKHYWEYGLCEFCAVNP